MWGWVCRHPDMYLPLFHWVFRWWACRGWALVARPVAAQAGPPGSPSLKHLPQLLHSGHGGLWQLPAGSACLAYKPARSALMIICLWL